jgi:hypothetical protein
VLISSKININNNYNNRIKKFEELANHQNDVKTDKNNNCVENDTTNKLSEKRNSRCLIK